MRFEVLGPPQVRRDDGVVERPGRLRQAILSLLLARRNESVPVDFLLDALWGSAPDPRRIQRLHVHVHKLRRMLDASDRLSLGSGGYRLRVLPGELDAERFEVLITEASEIAGNEPERSAELARQALELWRGAPFHEVDVAELAGEAERLTELRLLGLEELYSAEVRLGRHQVVLAELAELARHYPLRERVQSLLIGALCVDGRRADAVAVCQRVRTSLARELGLEPCVKLRGLERALLAGDPIDEFTELSGRTPDRPAELPHDVNDFSGRQRELAELDAAHTGDQYVDGAARVVVITGGAGVGKTALAVRWAHRVKEQFPDGQLYVDLRGYGSAPELTADEVITDFLRALGEDSARIPEDLSARRERFHSILRCRRLLIVLDAAGTGEHVRPLLPRTSSCLALVTARDSLADLTAEVGAHRITVDRLSQPEARTLLRTLMDSDRGGPETARWEPTVAADLADALVEQCARLPLALRVAAERMRQPGGVDIDDLVAELADERARLDVLDAGGDPQTSVRTVLSWSYERLPVAAARAFRLCGLYPGTEPDIYAMAALVGAPETRLVRGLMGSLVGARLLEERADERFHLHALLRTYAQELAATDTESDRRAALGRLSDYYACAAAHAVQLLAPHELDQRPVAPRATTPVPAWSGRREARQWLAAERSNLVALAGEPAQAETAVNADLTAIAWRCCDMAGLTEVGRRSAYTRPRSSYEATHDDVGDDRRGSVPEKGVTIR